MAAVVQEQKGQRGSSEREGRGVVNMDSDSVGLSNSTNKSNGMEWQPGGEEARAGQCLCK